MIENSDIEVTEDECVCSLGTFDDAIPKAFMKAICDDNNISLDGQVWRTSLSAGKVECQPQEHVCCELETGTAQWH